MRGSLTCGAVTAERRRHALLGITQRGGLHPDREDRPRVVAVQIVWSLTKGPRHTEHLGPAHTPRR